MELFKILGTIAIDGYNDAKKDLDNITGYAGTASSKIGGAVKAVGGAFITAGKVAATGIAAAATGISALTQKAVSAYADYEQLVGGVETLFKDSAGIIQDYADAAYKTAGLSANEYMETVTSFSASLLQSLGGDTEKSAEYANQAIIDMSDNANKMGTDMSMIQSAYQGFAKQNYTMLDNLKLGYGGTQKEMYRLMEDAAKLDENFRNNAVFSLNEKGALEAKFSDITEAIHIVQTEMGITGTTAEEAEKTISGSLASMKSQWQNLLTAIANGDDWDIGVYIDNFIGTVETALGNIYPIIEKSLVGIGEMISKLSPIIAEKIPDLIQKLLPPLIESATQLVVEVAKNLPSILSTLGSALAEALDSIFSSVFGTEEGKVKEIIEKIIGTFQSVVDWISEHKALVEGLAIAIGSITAAIVIVNGVMTIATAVMSAFGVVMAVITSPITLVVAAIAAVIAIGVLLYKNWDTIKEKASELAQKVSETFGKIKDKIKEKIDGAKQAVKDGIEKIKSFFKFEWSLPKLKLPHFKIDGKFSLNPPSVPSFGIDWYAKAMNDPMIMNSPTAFGLNKNGQIMAGGEAGSEVVSGTDTLMNMISEAVAAKNERLENILESILSYMPQMANMQLVTDTGALVGAIAPQMDRELGKRAARSGRGV